MTRRVGYGWIALLAVAGCGTVHTPPTVSPRSTDFVRRHHDQVCQVDGRQLPVVVVSELFDTAGLLEDLEAIGSQPLPMKAGATDVEWGTADYVVRYSRDGSVLDSGVWEASISDIASDAVAAALGSRSRQVSGLLNESGFRAVVKLSQPPSIEVAAPIVCSPHVRHPDGGRAYGLPEGVTTRLARSDFRPRRGGSRPGEATMSITLDDLGQVDSVATLAGDSVSAAMARDVLSGMLFDPALRNGVGIPSTLVQTFSFLAR